MKKTIKLKMRSVFILLLFVLAANSIWAILNFYTLSNSIEEIMQANYSSVVAAQNLITSIERQDSAQLSFMFGNDKSSEQLFFENETIFLRWLARAEDNVTEIGEIEIINKINEEYVIYIKNFYILSEYMNTNKPIEARDYYYNSILPLFESVKENCRELQNLNQEAMLKLKDNAHNIAKRASYSTLIIAIVTIIFGCSSGFYLIGYVIRPIYDLIDKIKKIAKRDYSQQLDIASQDEIGELSREFNIMTQKLKDYDLLNINKLMDEKNKAEAIVTSISDGILVTDSNHNIILVNRAAEKALLIREKDVINKHFLESIRNEEFFSLVEGMNYLKEKDANKSFVELSQEIDDKTKFYRIIATPIIGQSKRIMGVVSIIQDITKLKEIDNMKSEFVATVSHEFRTPLTSITMGIGLMLDEVPGSISKEQRELLDAMKEDSNRLNNLVSELLDLSRIESGKLEMNFEKILTSDLFDKGIRMFQQQLDNSKIKVINDIEEQNKIYAKADINKIVWVITNLIGNALRYVPDDGTGIIRMSSKKVGNRVVLSITDNGIGIPEEYHESIFKKFIQLKDDKEKYGGAGLGLAISKEIVNAHGGDIWVSSEMGKGSTFYFSLEKY